MPLAGLNALESFNEIDKSTTVAGRPGLGDGILREGEVVMFIDKHKKPFFAAPPTPSPEGDIIVDLTVSSSRKEEGQPKPKKKKKKKNKKKNKSKKEL